MANTQCEFMKLITRANVSCLDVDIHKSKEVFPMIQDFKTNTTIFSVVLATNLGMAC